MDRYHGQHTNHVSLNHIKDNLLFQTVHPSQIPSTVEPSSSAGTILLGACLCLPSNVAVNIDSSEPSSIVGSRPSCRRSCKFNKDLNAITLAHLSGQSITDVVVDNLVAEGTKVTSIASVAASVGGGTS